MDIQKRQVLVAQHLVNPEITKYWNFPRSPVVPTVFLMLTVSPLGRWKATVSWSTSMRLGMMRTWQLRKWSLSLA